jgi:GNAT superfamily N-acetyltransferase
MTPSEYEIVRYEPAFKAEILHLQTELWGKDAALNGQYFEWKYENNPYIVDAMPIYVALHQGQVVAMRGYFSAEWIFGGRRLPHCLSAADAFVHPDHRRRGLFNELTIKAQEDLPVALVLILSAGPSSMSVPGYLKLGWQQIGAWQGAMYRAPVRQASVQAATATSPHLGQRIFNRVARPLTRLLAPDQKTGVFPKLDETFRSEKKRYRGHLQVEAVASAQAMAQLAARLNRNDQIHHVRDEAYFAWRFQNPFCQYRFLYWQDEGLQGYLVLQQWIKRHRNLVNIVDWEFTSAEVLENLLQAVVQLTDAEKITFWGVELPEATERRLEKTEFHFAQANAGTIGADIGALTEDAPYRSPILLKTVNAERIKDAWGINLDQLSDISNWDFRGVASDYY